MKRCTRCQKGLMKGEEYGLLRVQLWKTQVGSPECKPPDLDDTRIYCLTCVGDVETHI
jgi:hypothetical protein